MTGRLILLAVPLLIASTAFAHGESAAAPERKPAAPKTAGQTAAERDRALSADMEASLRKAGFTDLQIMPNSILVRAKDKTGKPVAMVLNPGSMTEIVTLDPHSGSAAAGNGARAPLTGSGLFATVLPTERLATTLLGLKVHDVNGEEIGTVKDLAVDHDGVQAYILAVGGILGIGDRYVAIAPAAIALTYDQGANSYRATMNASADQLKAAPPFTYEGPFKAGRD